MASAPASTSTSVHLTAGPSVGRIHALASDGGDIQPTLDSDGLDLVFTSDCVLSFDLWESKRASRQEAFAAPEPLSMSTPIDDEVNPSLSADGQTLLFARYAASQDAAIWLARRQAGTWQAPSPVAELNTGGNNAGATLFPDGRTVIFSSDRETRDPGRLHLFVARRPGTSDAFTCIERVQLPWSAAGSEQETDAFVTRDGVALYFTSMVGNRRELFRAPILGP